MDSLLPQLILITTGRANTTELQVDGTAHVKAP